MDTDMEQTSGGFTRRSMIKRGAIVGGALVWAAPVVQTLAMPGAAAASPSTGGPFQCSYALVVYSLNGGQTLFAVKFEQGGGCSQTDTDGDYKGQTLPSCSGQPTYAINDTNNITANGTVIPSGDCNLFTISSDGKTVSSTSATIEYVLIHDGCITNGTVDKGTTVCGPTSSFTVPSCCTASGG